MDDRLKLKSVNDGGEYLLSPPSVLVGRDPSCDVVIARGLLSRHHARFSCRDGQWSVEDLNSTNGTYVNNREITRPTKVSAGDVVRLGIEAFGLLSLEQGDLTIPAGKLGAEADGSAPLPHQPAQRERPQSREQYSVPPRFAGSRGANTRYSRTALDQLLDEIFSDVAEIPEAAVIFFRGRRRPPIIYGLTPGSGESNWTIGRDRECDLRIHDPSVSRLHAVLVHQSGQWMLVDSDSTNGLRVDDALESEFELEDDVSVELGRVAMVFRLLEGFR